MSEAEVNEKTMEALKVVHIEQLKDKQIYKLSGGEKKLASMQQSCQRNRTLY